MELPEKKTEDEDFMKIKIYTYLLTSESDKFDETNGINQVGPTNKPSPPPGKKDISDIVLTAFDVRFTHSRKFAPPSKETQMLVKESIQDSIINNEDMHRIMRSIDTDDVINAHPHGFPETDSIQIAEFILTPDKQGMIGLVEIDEINNITD